MPKKEKCQEELKYILSSEVRKSGKITCEQLKQMRQLFADTNGIPYQVNECNYPQNCAGTCPVCEAEMQYLMQKIKEKKACGESIIYPQVKIERPEVVVGEIVDNSFELMMGCLMGPDDSYGTPDFNELDEDLPFD